MKTTDCPVYFFENLPTSLVEHTLSFLRPEEVARLRAVNRSMQKSVDNTAYGLFLTYCTNMRVGSHRELHETAAIQGCPLILEWIENMHGKGVFDERICAVAAHFGKTEVLKWLRARNCPWDPMTCAEAARRGHLDTLKWVRHNGCTWDEMTFELAVSESRHDILHWVLEQSPPCPYDERGCKKAAENGDVKTLMWIRDRGCPWDGEVLYEAARAKHEETLEWASQNGCPRDHSLLMGVLEATLDGDLETLKLLRKYECCPLHLDICKYAAKYKHMHVLLWARENNFPWDEWTCASAAESGDLTILKWLRKNGCPWDGRACANAARKGHLHVLRWARAQNPPAPWSDLTFYWALWSGEIEVLRWLELNKCPRDDRVLEYAQDSDPGSVQWVQDHILSKPLD